MSGNPFILEPYRSKELFCDREKETNEIINYLKNGRNITLISPRRLGKTGLIYRIFDEIRTSYKEFDTFYVDISASQNVEDFVKLLSEAVVSVLNKQTRIAHFFKAIGRIRPILSYDTMSGKPEVSWTYRNEEERNLTLKAILSYLDAHSKQVILAIDEFQQIREYKGIDMEALLRTYIQPLHNIRFIFCGSRKHTMTDIFSNAKRPFYESTTFISLGKLDPGTYACFIEDKFKDGKKSIPREIISEIVDWTRDHTFYTQMLCNEVYYRSGRAVRETDFYASVGAILMANRDRFLEIQRLVTPAQWRLMRAIAREGQIHQPTAGAFLKKYDLGSAPAVLKNLKSLTEKELILAENSGPTVVYSVYNVFLSRYLETQ